MRSLVEWRKLHARDHRRNQLTLRWLLLLDSIQIRNRPMKTKVAVKRLLASNVDSRVAVTAMSTAAGSAADQFCARVARRLQADGVEGKALSPKCAMARYHAKCLIEALGGSLTRDVCNVVKRKGVSLPVLAVGDGRDPTSSRGWEL